MLRYVLKNVGAQGTFVTGKTIKVLANFCKERYTKGKSLLFSGTGVVKMSFFMPFKRVCASTVN